MVQRGGLGGKSLWPSARRRPPDIAYNHSCVRILVVVSGQKWLGGLTIQTALLCRELERLGHQVAVVSIGAPAVIDQFAHGEIRHGNGGPAGQAPPEGSTRGDYVFRYEVVADAARYLPPGPPPMRATGASAVRIAGEPGGM